MGYASATFFPQETVGKTKKRTKREPKAIKRQRRSLSDANHGTSSSHSGARHVIGRGEPLVMTHLRVEMVFFFFFFGWIINVWMFHSSMDVHQIRSRNYNSKMSTEYVLQSTGCFVYAANSVTVMCDSS